MKRANLFILQAAQGDIKRTPSRAHVEMFGKHTQSTSSVLLVARALRAIEN
jgi:hypothetical protein